MPSLWSEPEDSDARLMTQVAGGDARAQARLVRRLSGRVLKLTRLLLKNNADAEDAAQLALLQILSSAGGYRSEARLEAWADRITVRVTLKRARHESRRRGLLKRWLVPGDLPWGRAMVVRAPDVPGLQPYFSRLSEERREVLILRHVLEYKVEEIAELTDTPVGTVKDRLVIARKQLREWLSKEAVRTTERPTGGVATTAKEELLP